MTDSPNPYQPPEDSRSDNAAHVPPVDVDFPHGLLSPLWIALGGATIEVALVNAPQLIGNQFGSLVLLLMLFVWSTSFAWIARMLPGTEAERSNRGFVSVLLSFPALIMYVPVCGFVATTTGSDLLYSMSPLSMSLGTVVAFVSIVFLFALRVRHVVRVSHRKQ